MLLKLTIIEFFLVVSDVAVVVLIIFVVVFVLQQNLLSKYRVFLKSVPEPSSSGTA